MAKKAAKKVIKENKAPKHVPFKTEIMSGTEKVGYDDATRVHPSLKGYFSYNLHKVHLQHKGRFENSLKHLGFQVVHLGVLRVIEKNLVNQNQLSEQLGIDKASIVKLIDRLESLKLIVREQCPKDRRVNFLKITPKGVQCMKEAIAIADTQDKEFLKKLTSEESEIFRDLLQRLVD